MPGDVVQSGPPIEIQMLETLNQILLELRGMRLAVVHMATQDRSAVPDDFDMTSNINTQEVLDQIS